MAERINGGMIYDDVTGDYVGRIDMNGEKQYFPGATDILGLTAAINGAVKTVDLTAPGVVPIGGFAALDTQAILDNSLPMQSYAALRLYAGRAIGIRITTPGVAGLFQQDVSDTLSVDNGGTIIIDTLGRRWKRIFNGILEAEWFNAKGDGTTDDTVALRNWLNTVSAVHSLSNPNSIYLVAPTAGPGSVILPLVATRNIIGRGAKIKIKDSSGQFYGILGSGDFGVDLSGTKISSIVFDHNKNGNTYTASANVLTQPHFTFVARNGVDIDFINNIVLDPVCTNSVYLNGVVSGVALIKRSRVNNNKFLNVGGSAIVHDHSTIYITGDDAEIKGNYGQANGLGTTGAACFIEPHSTRFEVSDNRAYDFDGLANITGIYSGGDTVDAKVFNNAGTCLQFGIRIFSTTSGLHTTGYGIDGMDVYNNNIRIRQSLLPAGTNRAYLGVGVQSGSSLPIRNLKIRNNTVEYDSETVAGTYNGLASALGILESSNNTVFENIYIGGNTVINSPGPALALGFGNGTFVNCRIDVNTFINPGQGLSASVASYKAGIWLGGQIYTGFLKIAKQNISDTYATTRLNFGIYATPVSDSTACIFEAEADIVLIGDGVVFSRSFANVGNKVLPLFLGRLNKVPAFTTHTYKVGSVIEDTLSPLTYKIKVQGSTWLTEGYATTAPTTGVHQAGSLRVFPVPVAGGAQGTICVTAGTPGTWKNFGTVVA